VPAIDFRLKSVRIGTAMPAIVQLPGATDMQKLLHSLPGLVRRSLRCNGSDGCGHHHSSQDQTILIACDYRIDAINGLSLWERSR
jgi:hypothetical protein